jgi:signal transduction histidine kinase
MEQRWLKYCLQTIILLTVLVSQQTVLAQTAELKTLHKKLHQAKDSSSYVKALNSISFFHHRNNLDSCFWYATRALDISLRLHDEKGKSYAYTNFALFYTRKRNLKLAIIYNYRALKIDQALSDSGSISIDLSNLALAYRAEGNIGKAQEYEQQSLLLGSRFPDLGDYKIDLINYLEYYWNKPAKSDSVQWALKELRHIASKQPYSMQWYEARMFETLLSLKTTPFREVEKKINDIAEEAYRKGLPDETITAYFHMIHDTIAVADLIDTIAYAEKIFLLAKKIGDDESVMAVINKLYNYYLPKKDYRQLALYGASIRQLAVFEQSEAGKLPVVDHMSYFLKEQQMQELQIADQLQQHAIAQSDLQKTTHLLLLIFLLSLLVLLLIITAIFCISYYTSRRQTAALAAMNADITEKNIRLQEGDDFKNKLLSLIAQDFRAPIKDILNTAALWQLGTHDHPSMLESILRVEQDSRRTLDNFDGILRWIKSRFSDFQYHPEPCHIHEMLTNVVNSMQQDAESKGLDIAMDVPLNMTTTADHEMLQFVHRTVLRQIISLTGNGGSIRIKALQLAGATTVTIKGHPIPVTPSLLQLLELSQQEDKLILLTCKDFMTEMGGSLKVSSDRADTFAFRYVLETPPQ